MERELRDISLSDDLQHAFRLVRIEKAKKRQQELIAATYRRRQDLFGIIICLVSIVVAWFLSEDYGQTLHFLSAMPFIGTGIYLILTDRNFEQEAYDGQFDSCED